MTSDESQDRGTVPKRRRRKSARPAEIITAALSVFAEKGYAEATMEEVAARVAISKPTIYLYFKTKEDLFIAAVLDRISPKMDQAARTAGHPDLPVRAAIRHLLDQIYTEFVATDASVIMRLIVREGHRFPELREHFERHTFRQGRSVLRGIIEAGQASGELRTGPYGAQVEVLLAPAMVLAVFGQTIEPFLSADRHAYLEAHLDLVLNGILAK
jgi:AcrR family transcriptional regulator